MKCTLSAAESGMLLEQLKDPDSTEYNLQLLFSIRGAGKRQVEQAFFRVLSLHEALRSRYGFADGAPVRILTEELPEFVWKRAGGEREAADDALAASAPFDLQAGVPIRLAGYSLDSGGIFVCMEIHHIAFDGGSMNTLMEELFSGLKGLALSPKPDLSVLPAPEKEREERGLSYFREVFSGGVPRPEMPLRGSRPKRLPPVLACQTPAFPPELLRLVEQGAGAAKVTVFQFFLAAVSIVLGRYCGSEDLVFGIPVNLREEKSRGMVGMFVNTAPIRLRPVPDKSLTDYLREVREAVLCASRRFPLPFARIVEEFGGVPEPSRHPVFDVSVNYLYEPEELSEGVLSLSSRVPLQKLRRDMAITIRRSGERFALFLQYSPLLYADALITRLLEQLLHTLGIMCKAPSRTLREAGELPEGQLKELQALSVSRTDDRGHPGEPEKPARGFVHESFEAAAKAQPGKTALIARDGEKTFGELNAEANRIARGLLERGLKPGAPVLLLLPRKTIYFAALFGVLKAGGAFIPCDPAYPPERIRHILADSGAEWILTDPENASVCPAGKTLLAEALLAGEASTDGRPADGPGPGASTPYDPGNPGLSLSPGQMAYMIYTSGSTGTPKGVMLSHGGLANFLVSHPANPLYLLLEEEIGVMLSVTTVSFDMSFKDTLGVLAHGKTLVFASEEQMNDPRALTRLIRAHGVEAMNATPSRYLQYLRYPPFGEALSGLKLAAAGGEPYPEALLERLKALGIPHLLNTYGPTETTISSNMACLEEAGEVLTENAPDQSACGAPGKDACSPVPRRITVGRPLLNVREWIMDAHGRLLPRGARGELWIGGPGVAIGYRGLEELNASRFAIFQGERYFRSGDLAAFDEDGNVLILGRLDDQVKLRGLRIELGEVESVLTDHPGVEEAAADVRRLGGREVLFSWYTGREALPEEELRKHLSGRLPDYMVPSAFLKVPAIPTTPNGKTDRKALPLPAFTEASGDQTLPETPEERIIHEMVGRLTELTHFGIHTPFAELGLTSLTMVGLMLALSERFGRDFSLKELRGHDTVAKLAAYVAAGTGAWPVEGAEKGRAKEPDGKGGALSEEAFRGALYPLTGTQLGIWLECLSHPESSIYNIPVLWRLGEGIDLQRLAEGVSTVIDAHPLVKAYPVEKEGGVFLAQSDLPARVEITRREKLPNPEELLKPFSLRGGALYRAQIFETPEGNAFYLDLHHLIADGYSRGLLQREIEEAYGGKPPLPESFTGFALALEEERERNSPAYEEAGRFYGRLLEGASPTRLPTLPGEGTGAGYLTLEAALSPETLKAFCRETGISPNTFFNGAFGFVLTLFSGSEEALFTTIYDGRDSTRLMRTAAMLVKTIPVRCAVLAETETASYLRALHTRLAGAMENTLYSFSEISADCGLRADYLLAFQEGMGIGSSFCGEPCGVLRPRSATPKGTLSLEVALSGKGVVFSAEYDRAILSREYVERLMECMAQVCGELPIRKRLGEVRPLSAEGEEALKRLHDTDWPVSVRPACRLLEESAEKYPERTALIANGERVSYGELNAAANRLARLLLRRGLGIGEFCAVLLTRGKAVCQARQAVLKAGGAFVPLDPAYPDERIAHILKDSGCRFIITDRAQAAERGALLTGLTLCFPGEEKEESADNPGLDIPFASPAYVIYTSGSTGQPKGVVISQKNLVSFVDDNPKNREILGFIRRGRVSLALASMSFDVSVMEECVPLAHGLTVCIANEEEQHELSALARLCLENRVDILTCTPSFLANLLEEPAMRPVIASLKTLDVGAEAFPAGLYEAIRRINPTVYIMNGYGPTETTISCTMAVMTGKGPVTIGLPGSNVKAAILDSAGHVLPMGAVGELVILGAGVGIGYLNRPELTEKSFFTLWDRPAYRTGDMARLLPTGEIEYLGRRDGQVKLRGLRVELGEIEEAMSLFPGVKQTKVLVRSNGREDYLAGFFAGTGEVSPEALRAFLAERLPGYMVPEVLMSLPEMPLTVNGKIDTARLPDTGFTGEESDQVLPANALEEEFCALFAKVLKRERVGATSSFFELGGTSLSAMRLMSLAAAGGRDLVYRNIFDHATPRALADFLMGQGKAAGTSEDAETSGQSGASKPFAACLSGNVPEKLPGIASSPLGSVLLTGATGFLGIHVLRELLNSGRAFRVYCLVRETKELTAAERLKTLLGYYFGQPFTEEFGKRLRVIRGDVNDPLLSRALKGIRFYTVINCAAVVKHFAKDDSIARVNVEGVRNLTDIALEKGARFVQVSTESVAGQSVNGSVPEGRLFTERDWDIGQTLGTKYSSSKYEAERLLLSAMDTRGLNAKIIRIGNLMSRKSDGEFQINSFSNGFMSRLKAYVVLGCFPLEELDVPVELSPVDETAKALVLLAGTQERYTVFHADNCHMVHMANLLEALSRCGMPLEVVPEEEFEKRLGQMLGDEEKSLSVSSLISYQTNGADRYRYVGVSNAFTVKALYRLGFSWSVITPAYIEQAIRAIRDLGFFEL